MGRTSFIDDRKRMKFTSSRNDLRLQLRNEVDKLALMLSEFKAQADKVQDVADALGEQLLGSLEPV